jgi:hypothetical protein
MYGSNPLRCAKKINVNEVIYYLWQVVSTQHCLSEGALIDFPIPSLSSSELPLHIRGDQAV